MLEVEGISVRYGNVQVLWDESFDVREGEILALLGPNGAGKTTTLKSIIGLLRPFSGTIRFLGKDLGGMRTFDIVRLGISLVPEGRRLFPHLSVRENLIMGAHAAKGGDGIEERIEAVYQIFPALRGREGQMAYTLSGGEQQMLAIARGLMSRPRLLLLDEPSSGLAPLMSQRLFEAIQRLNEEEGITILLVEQDVGLALEVADRGVILEGGRVALEGGSQELLESELVREAYLGI